MDTVLLVLVGVVLLGIVVKLSSSARSERKLVMARLAEEDDLRGPMPTELLFRDAAPAVPPVPPAAPAPAMAAPEVAPVVPDVPEVPAPASSPGPAPVETAAAACDTSLARTDVGAFFAGIQLPADLVPWTGAPVTDQEASFTTMTAAPQVLAELGAELARLGIAASWDAASLGPGAAATATLVRDGYAGSVTLYASADQAQDDQGVALFKGLMSGTSLVRLSV